MTDHVRFGQITTASINLIQLDFVMWLIVSSFSVVYFVDDFRSRYGETISCNSGISERVGV